MEFSSVNSSISEQYPCVIGQCLREMNEELLVSAARSGDRNAFNELYGRHSRKVLPRIYGITRNQEDAEDVLQDAGLRAFLHFKTYEGRSSFQTWFTRIAINSAFMALRKRHIAEISIEQLSDHEESPRLWEPRDTAETPEARYVRCEREALMAKAIKRLPCIFHEILELRHSHEYSIMQIAEELGISLPAAKSRLMRARKTLRRLSKERPRSELTSTSDVRSLKPRIRSRVTTVRG